jgi:gas vesicle protein
MADKDKTAVVGALMLVAGGIIGAGVALLFAPQSGEKTRREISRYVKRTSRRAGELAEDFSDSISDMVETVGDKAVDLLEQGKDMAYDAKKELLNALDEGQAKLQKQRMKLAKLLD